jgi:hypothetical protein
MTLSNAASKSAFASRTVWGALIAGLGPLLPVVIKALGWDQYVSAEELTNLGSVLMTVGGSLFAIYGRVTAKTRIG